jgi:hypothetical protein
VSSTKLQSDPASRNGHSLAELEEEVVISRVSDAIAEAASDHHRPAIFDEDARQAARRAAVDIATTALIARSAETAAHSDDVDIISEGIGRRLGLSGERLEDVMVAARLHDIGKLGLPQGIIEKPAALDDAEWALIRRHTIIGEQVLLAVPELRSAARLVRHSHERWDGGGYPDGLAGDDIPLGSRIVFCADAYEAIRSDRPYRAGRSAAEALAEIRSCAGTQFDPAVVAALEGLARQLRATRNGHRPSLGRSRRLMALMLIVSVGTCGSALARSGLMPEPKTPRGTLVAGATKSGSGTGAFGTGVQAAGSSGALGSQPADSARGAEATLLGGAGLLTMLPSQLTVPSQSSAPSGLGELPGAAGGTSDEVKHPGSQGVRDHGRGIGHGKGQGKGRGAELGRGHHKTSASKVKGSEGAAGKSGDSKPNGSGKSKSRGGEARHSYGPSPANEKGSGPSQHAKSGKADGAGHASAATNPPKRPKPSKPAKPPKGSASPTPGKSASASPATDTEPPVANEAPGGNGHGNGHG